MREERRIEAYNKLDLETFKEQMLKGIALNYASKSTRYQITLESATTITKADLEACFDLITYTSKSDYENSCVHWRPRAKKAEMKEVDMRYLLVHSDDDNHRVLGFASFMLLYDAGEEIVYLYEVHLSDAVRGQGLGKHLIELVSKIGDNARVEKIMLTVFNRNSKAVELYAHLGFDVDDSSPRPRTLRNGVVKEADYQILSRPVR